MENNFQAGHERDEATLPPPEGSQPFPWPGKGAGGQQDPTGEQSPAWRDCPDGKAAAGGVYSTSWSRFPNVEALWGIRYPLKRSQRKWSSCCRSYSREMGVEARDGPFQHRSGGIVHS